RFLLTPTLALSGSLGLLDTEILEGASQGIDIRGKHLVSAPPVTASAALDWHLPVGRNRLSLHAGLSYASRQHFDLLNTPALDQTAYALADASLSFEWTKAGLTATFWGRNLTDKAYITYVADASSLGFIYRHVGTPRMYGASIRKTF
ncbi:MAG TPA: TonB-dependent receptor, partial [Novosphingobium sp.]|nr:TonB-dependent receptor [Novosphingobium sp.]